MLGIPANVAPVVLVSAMFLVHGGSSTSLYGRLRELERKQPEGLHLPTYSDWLNIPPYLQSVLISIDDKLRGLDTFSHTLRLAKLDYSLDQLVRRLDNIETKLGSLQTKVGLRLDKVKEVVIAKDIKEGFTTDHLSRSINDLVEKLNNKFIFIDAKLDLVSERVVNYVGQMERSLEESHDEVLKKLIKIEDRQEKIEAESKEQGEKVNHIKVEVNRVKMLVKDDVMSLLVIKTDELRESIKTGITEISEQGQQAVREMTELRHSVGTLQQVPHQVNKTVHKVATSMKKLLNETLQSRYRCDVDRGKDAKTLPGGSDGVLMNISTTLEKASQDRKEQLNALDSDLNHFMKKVYNGIQELWHSSDIAKAKLEEMLKEGNATRDYLKNQFSIMRKEVMPASTIRPEVAKFQDTINNKIHELGQSVDKSFETMLIAQNHFINSCQNMMNIQEELPTITLVLHSMLIEMRNRTGMDELQSFVFNSNMEITASLERLHETIGDFHSDTQEPSEVPVPVEKIESVCSTENC